MEHQSVQSTSQLYNDFDVTERKRSEQVYLESQQDFDAFFVASPAGLAIVDDQLRYTKINETLAAINGPTVAEHIGQTARQLMPDLAPTIEPMFRKVLTEGKEYLNVEVNGETPAQPGVARQWMVSYFPMKALDGPIPSIGIIVIETTERKRAEDALRESDERPREAQRVGQIGSLEGDIHTDELWWPDGLFHLFGLERAEFFPTKDSFTELLHPDECGGHHDIRTG